MDLLIRAADDLPVGARGGRGCLPSLYRTAVPYYTPRYDPSPMTSPVNHEWKYGIALQYEYSYYSTVATLSRERLTVVATVATTVP